MTNGGYTTGAGRDEAELRRRNVDSYEKANGQHVYKVEAEDRKKLQKVGLSIALGETKGLTIASQKPAS